MDKANGAFQIRLRHTSPSSVDGEHFIRFCYCVSVDGELFLYVTVIGIKKKPCVFKLITKIPCLKNKILRICFVRRM